MANREPSTKDDRRSGPAWWSRDDDAAWDRARERVIRDWAAGLPAESSDRGTTTGSVIGDIVTHMTGHPDLHYPRGEDHLGIATSETARSTAGMAPSRGDWRRAEPAIRFGHGAWNHYGGEHAVWSDALEETLRREWQTVGDGGAWDEVRDWVRRGWDSARRRQ